jgi:hypothetical protein
MIKKSKHLEANMSAMNKSFQAGLVTGTGNYMKIPTSISPFLFLTQHGIRKQMSIYSSKNNLLFRLITTEF